MRTSTVFGDEDKRIFEFDLEKRIDLDPDVLILLTGPMEGDPPEQQLAEREEAEFRNLPASRR